MKACYQGHFNIVELLLKNKADVDLKSNVSVGGNREGGGKGVRVYYSVY